MATREQAPERQDVRPVAPAVQGAAGALACLTLWLSTDVLAGLFAGLFGSPSLESAAQWATTLVGAGCLLAVWHSGPLRPHLARGAGLVGLVVLFGPWTAASAHDPALVLVLLVSALGAAAWLVDALSMAPPHWQSPTGVEHDSLRCLGAASTSGLLWLGGVLHGAESISARVALAAAFVVVAITVAQRTDLGPTRRRLNLLTVITTIAGLFSGLPLVVAFLPALGLIAATALWRPRELVHRSAEGAVVRGLARILFDPALTVVATFLVGGVVGGLLLSTPEAAQGPEAVPFVDALFTSFSAICVTGLIVVDTPNAYSAFGEGVILLVIQIGGLGIMTLSAAALTFLGRRMSLRHEATVVELLRAEDRGHMGDVLRRIVVVTFVSEAVGAAALTALFAAGGDSFATAVWRGLFTSISAFCNAGFALQTDSLVPYQSEPLILLTIAVLITVGGLGPVVVTESLAAWRRRRLSLQTRIILWTSLALTGAIAVLYLALEWDQTLGHMGLVDKLTNALFQSVTLRTAGFNSVDLSAMTAAAFTLTLPMMFVGGSPGSTAGGAKTTTLAILALVLRAAFRGEERVVVGGREISTQTTHQAAAVAFVGLGAVAVTLLLLLMTQPMPFMITLFEVFSALGTVGLSIGGTGMLDLVGKIIVMIAMFAGRIGPLTLLVVLVRRQRDKGAAGLPVAHIDIG